jgi:hypothetical protein
MFKKTIIAGLAATAILAAVASSASATPMGPTFDVEQENVLTNNPTVTNDELACYGCISPSTGRVRDNYVRPHVRSNGTSVNGYWRS